MKNIVILFVLMVAFGCATDGNETAVEQENYNTPEELAKLEKVRETFQLAIKEGRYDDVRPILHPEGKAVGPGHPLWAKMYGLRGERGLFPYDSIVMKPKETVILNDTMAYDFGVSTVYTTDENDSLYILRDTFLVLMRKDSTGKWTLYREVASAKVIED